MLIDKEPILTGIHRLQAKGHEFDAGLTDLEIGDLEFRLGLTFPPDLRFLLQTAVPMMDWFTPWRSDYRVIDRWFRESTAAMLSGVERNSFWSQDWGARPSSLADRLAVAARQLDQVPRLIPIAGILVRTYLPATPCVPGNPLFSLYQGGCLPAGRNLGDFLHWVSRQQDDWAVGISPTPVDETGYHYIPFWTELAR